jgi:hypothetical protein
MRDTHTFLYAIEHPHGYYKIGRGEQPKQRVTNIQIGSPYKLQLRLAVRYFKSSVYSELSDLEPEVHERLESYHKRGEWFEICYRELLHTLARLVEDEDSAAQRLYEISRENERKSTIGRSNRLTYRGPL